MVVINPAVSHRAPIWPVIIAPLVTGVYYLAIKGAFAQEIVSVLGKTAASDIDLSGIAAPHWGSHWVYRGVAELISTGFATFVAAGLAHGRERAAAIAGGCIISLGFLARIAFLLYALKYMDPEEFTVPEPWYQYAIEGLMIFAPPIIGAYVAEAAQDIHRQQPLGFGGINRLHFLWLWFAAFPYARGLIAPVGRIYAVEPDSIFSTFIILLVGIIPAAAIAVPGYFGLAILSGHLASALHPAARNLLGVVVLVVGWTAGIVLQFGWYWVLQKIYEAIFG
jgi:hypothetical protein